MDIIKFEPNKAKLTKLAKGASILKIDSIKDKIGYQQVDEYRKDLQKARCNITRIGKMLRHDSIKFQKAVIVKERGLVAIIAPAEQKLKAMQGEIYYEEQKILRKLALKRNQAELKEYGIEISDEDLLELDDEGIKSLIKDKRINDFKKEHDKEYDYEREEGDRYVLYKKVAELTI